MGKLGRGPERQSILVEVVGGDRAAALDRMRAAAVLLEADAGPVRRTRERTGNVAVRLAEIEQEIAWPQAMGARCL